MKEKRTILVVDDDETILSAISAFITLEMDHKVLTYSSPSNALDELDKNTKIDFIISDFLMPDIDGIQFLEEMKNRYPDVPRILLTGYADKENAIKAVNKAGIYYYLEKPWDNEELLLTIQNGLEKKDLILDTKKFYLL